MRNATTQTHPDAPSTTQPSYLRRCAISAGLSETERTSYHAPYAGKASTLTVCPSLTTISLSSSPTGNA
jgi:hypothetical protein